MQDHCATCDRCGGQAALRLATKAHAGFPAFRVYTCEGCGRVMWQKAQVAQQQQQQQPQKKE
jgi:uncharacterized protein with PIN domain